MADRRRRQRQALDAKNLGGDVADDQALARLAGVPPELLDRAKSILHDIELDSDDLAPRIAGTAEQIEGDAPGQLALFAAPVEPSAVEKAVAAIDLDQTTPMEALLKLRELRELME